MQGSWGIYLRKYVFMYCHDLRMFKKSGEHYSIPCEDGVDGYMAITPYDLKLDEVTLTQIVAVAERLGASGETEVPHLHGI